MNPCHHTNVRCSCGNLVSTPLDGGEKMYLVPKMEIRYTIQRCRMPVYVAGLLASPFASQFPSQFAGPHDEAVETWFPPQSQMFTPTRAAKIATQELNHGKHT